MHVQIAAGLPFAIGDALQAGGRRHERRLLVGERADHSSVASDHAAKALDVVGTDAPPTLAGILHIRTTKIHQALSLCLANSIYSLRI